MQTLSPAQDSVIARKYDAKTIQEKTQNKLALQKELGWAMESKRPMICLPSGVTEALGGELLKEVLPGLLTLPVELLIRGKGETAYGSFLSKLASAHSHRVAIIPNQDAAVRKMLAASDMALFLSEAEDLAELAHCLRYGTVPLAPSCDALDNYDPNQEKGTAFTYDKLTAWHCFAAVGRALETYRFPFDWRTIQRQCMDAGS